MEAYIRPVGCMYAYDQIWSFSCMRAYDQMYVLCVHMTKYGHLVACVRVRPNMVIWLYVCIRPNMVMFLFYVLHFMFYISNILSPSQRTLTMFVGVVALRYQHRTILLCSVETECHNPHKHGQSPLTNYHPIRRVCVITSKQF